MTNPEGYAHLLESTTADAHFHVFDREDLIDQSLVAGFTAQPTHLCRDHFAEYESLMGLYRLARCGGDGYHAEHAPDCPDPCDNCRRFFV